MILTIPCIGVFYLQDWRSWNGLNSRKYRHGIEDGGQCPPYETGVTFTEEEIHQIRKEALEDIKLILEKKGYNVTPAAPTDLRLYR